MANSYEGALNKANKSILSLVNSLDKVKLKIIEVSDEAAKSLGKISDAIAPNQVSQQVRKQREEIAKLNKALQQQKKILADVVKVKKRDVTATKRLTQETKRLNRETGRTRAGFKGLLGGAQSLIAAFGIIGGIQLFVNILKNSYELIKTFDGIQFAMQKITENMYDMSTSQKFLLEITRNYGTELVTTTNRYIKFLAAAKQSGLTIGQTEDIFRSMTKASAVLGLKTDELRGVYLALEQMLSKGKITTEELRRQLGERLPGAMGIMASSMGVTIPQLDKMMKKGEVLSAEVLPEFAQAVERAYGIEKVEQVETLISAQNRLTNAWKEFILVLSEGDSWIKRELMSTMEGWAKIMNFFTGTIMTNDQKVLASRMKWSKSVRETHNTTVRNLLKQQKDYNQDSEKLEEDIANKKLEILKARTLKQEKLLKEELDELVFQQTEIGKKQNEISLRVALSEIDVAEEQFESAKKIYEDYVGTLEAIRKDRISPKDRRKKMKYFEQLGIEELDDAINLYGRAWERWDFLRKKIRQSDVVIPDNEKDSHKVLREITDLERLIQIENLKEQIRLNKEEIADEQTTWEHKLKLISENTDLANQIAKLGAEHDIQILKDKRTREEAQLLKDREADKITQAQYEKQMEDIKKEFEQREALRRAKAGTETFKNLEQLAKDKLELEKKKLQETMDIIDDEKNLKIIAAKEEYQNSSKNAKDKAKLEEKLKRIAIEAANAKIDAQIVLLEAQKAELENMNLSTEHIDRTINKLIASKETLEGKTKTEIEELNNLFKGLTKTFGEVFDIDMSKFDFFWDSAKNSVEQWGDLSKEIIGSVLDASLKRYDIELQQAQITRDLILENELASEEEKENARKRFDEERRRINIAKAKQERQNTLIKIAVDTAAAVARVLAQEGALAPFTIPSIVAIGLAQAALVASQPLPKFEGGTDSAPRGWALVDEKRPEVHTDRYGNIKSLGLGGPNLRYLERGDKIFRSHEDFINKMGEDEMQRAIWNLNASSNGSMLNKRIVDRSLLNEISGMRGDMSRMTRQFKKIAQRPINNKVTVELKEDRAY